MSAPRSGAVTEAIAVFLRSPKEVCIVFKWKTTYVKATLALTAFAAFLVASGAGMRWGH